jgi:hypothetical protein
MANCTPFKKNCITRQDNQKSKTYMKAIIHEVFNNIPIYRVYFRGYTFSGAVKCHRPSESIVPQIEELQYV